MTTSATESSAGVGRPRSFSDEDFLNAVARVLTKFGYQGLTLEAVAAEVGSSRPALNRRFGDKQGLIRSFVYWIVNQIDLKFEDLEGTLRSPLEILRAGSFAFSTGNPNQDQSDVPFSPSNQLRFFTNAWTDPIMRPVMADLSRTFETSAMRYLRAAVDCGELIPCDVDELAYLLTVSVTGALMHSVDNTDEDLLGVHERVFDATLRPYVRSMHSFK